MNTGIRSLDDFLLLLRGVKKMSNQYMALCPGHHDRQRSLSVTQADGRILPHCFAGCQLSDILKPLGLESRDLLLDSNHKVKPELRVIEATYDYYDYTDADGTLLFQVVRYRPKDFTQRRPDGKGGWIWSLGKAKRVLYYLPEVIQAIQDSHTIYIAEGEKDVGNLRKQGLFATCNPMGAGKWQDSYSDTLSRAKVVIIADKDTPGRNHAPASRQVTNW